MEMKYGTGIGTGNLKGKNGPAIISVLFDHRQHVFDLAGQHKNTGVGLNAKAEVIAHMGSIDTQGAAEGHQATAIDNDLLRGIIEYLGGFREGDGDRVMNYNDYLANTAVAKERDAHYCGGSAPVCADQGRATGCFATSSTTAQPGLYYGELLTSAHPEMANLPDIFVARKILSLEYQPYASGKIFRTPRSRPNLPFLDRH
jgi:hypothetical protein